jgi:hypothetical protein
MFYPWLAFTFNERKNMNTEITLPAEDLKQALPGLTKIIGRKTTLPVLSCVKVSRQKDGLVTLQATDLDSHATFTLNHAQQGGVVDVLVPVEQLTRAFKSGSKEPVTLVCEGRHTKLRYFIGGNHVQQPVNIEPCMRLRNVMGRLGDNSVERSALPWTRNWDETKYLPEFLMPPSEEKR